jgi:hypothetical protein
MLTFTQLLAEQGRQWPSAWKPRTKVPKNTRKGEVMNTQGVTHRLRPGIRLSLSAAIIAGLSALGAGALDAGTAGANTSGGGSVAKLPASCPSAVSLSTRYGYRYLKATGQIVGLSGSGCSTSSHPVTISIPYLVSSSKTVTPSCFVTAPTDCTFSFSFSQVFNLYLTEADAVAYTPGNGELSPYHVKVQFVANQPATGASKTVSFRLWTMD